MELFAVIATLSVLVVLSLFWAVTRDRKRDAEMALAAEEMKFEYQRDGRLLLSERFTRFELFQTGRRKRINNVIQGHYDNIEVLLFDYRYFKGSHRHFRVYRQTVGAFKIVGGELPEFSLRPEKVFHKLGTVAGYQDLDFAHHPRFSKSYLLRGPDEDIIRALFSPEVLEFLANHPGWCVEGGGQWLTVYRRDRRANADKLGDFVKDSFEICALFGIR